MRLIEIKNSPKKKEKQYFGNIENETIDNKNYRKVLFTSKNIQLVVMSLKPDEEIGMETHENGAQFIRVEQGKAEIVIGKEKYNASDNDVVIIPEGTPHNVTNIGKADLKLYVLYAPPEHDDGVVQLNKN